MKNFTVRQLRHDFGSVMEIIAAGATQFLTFDKRQTTIAKAGGLETD